MKVVDIAKCLNALEILKMQIDAKLDKLTKLGMFESSNFNDSVSNRCLSLKYALENTLQEIEQTYKEVNNE